MPPVIEIKNLSKKYNINHQQGGYVALREVIANALRHPIRFIVKKVAGSFKDKEDFWALRDINLTINQGEIMGIIGANGAGKSTLLKILSRITPPTTGEVRIQGKIASLLEIGTGFHPELTGRENIFLNGAILGMPRSEVARKFNDIVEFSGVGQFIDTPVKRYSSGMYVRLAFSVAAHMEPDILLVDEVLAVGDAEFQKKCLGKMGEVTQNAGRTILFVSHNMSAIQRLCTRTVLLEKGGVAMVGDTRKVVEHYLSRDTKAKGEISFSRTPHKSVEIRKVRIVDAHGQTTPDLDVNHPFSIEVEYNLRKDLKLDNIVEIIIKDINDSPILQIFDVDTNKDFFQNRPRGYYVSKFYFPANLFNEQPGKLQIFCGIPHSDDQWDRKENLDLMFYNPDNFAHHFFSGNRGGSFLLKIPSTITRINDGQDNYAENL